MDTNQKQSALTIDKKPVEAEMDLKPIVWCRRHEDEDSLLETRYMHVECHILAPSRGP